jgi:hypothetical protein
MKSNSVRLILLTVLTLLPSMAYSWSSDTSINTPIVVAPNSQSEFIAIPDRAGGAFIAWKDYRNENSTDRDIYGQHIDATGAIQWVENGIAISNAPGNQGGVKLAADGSGGCYTALGGCAQQWHTGTVRPAAGQRCYQAVGSRRYTYYIFQPLPCTAGTRIQQLMEQEGPLYRGKALIKIFMLRK